MTGVDKDAGRNCIIEIRQGTGDEAGLLRRIHRMYSKYAAKKLILSRCHLVSMKPAESRK